VTSCEVHGYHWPPVLGTVVHHIWPRGMLGPDVPENRVEVCSTGHLSIHRCLDDLLHGLPLSRGTRRERQLAQQGFDAWVAAGKPGRPVYELDG
jgi:hypothetical protein